MAAFDGHVRRVARHVEALRAKGRVARELTAPSSPSALVESLPIRVGPGANPGIILRGDTFAELGSPAAGSCAVMLWTNSPSLVSDGKITLIGPDIQEADGGSLPFGQVLIVAGEELGNAEHQSLIQAQHVADRIEGYMVKSSSRNLWGRVSKDAAAKGFCFETLGRALMAICKSSVSKVQAVEILFVTSTREDVLQLEEIARDVNEIGGEIVRESWKSKGYDLDCDLHCGSCEDKDVCDDLRKVIAAKEKKTRKRKTARAS